MRVLGIFSAYDGASAAVLADGTPRAEAVFAAEQGLAAALPGLVDEVLARAGLAIDLVAVATGPGSFTGLRAGIAVAAGVGLGAGVPVQGVTVRQTLAAALAESDPQAQASLAGRALWVAIHARRGRVFLDCGDGPAGYACAALPRAAGRVALAGNEANAVGAALAAQGADVMLALGRMPLARHVCAAGAALVQAGQVAPALPVYVDPPEARPARGLRAPPA